MADRFADDSIVRMSWLTGSGADLVCQTRAMAYRAELRAEHTSRRQNPTQATSADTRKEHHS